MKLQMYARVVTLAILIGYLSVGGAYGLDIKVTSWVGTNLLGEAEKELAMRDISYAIDIYNSILEGPRTVRLELTFTDLGDTVCARGSARFLANESGLPIADMYYPCPLISQLVNRDVPPSPYFHGDLYINSRFINNHEFDFSLTLPVRADKTDFLSVVLHELGHAMGFQSLVNGDGSWYQQGSEPPHRDIHDHNLSFEDFFGDYVPFESLNQAERLVALQMDTLYWSGSNVVAHGLLLADPAILSNGYSMMYAPYSSPIFPENNASHWDPSHSSPNQLIEPYSIRNLRDLGLLTSALRDMGWSLGPIVVVPPHIEITTSPAKFGSSQPVFISNNRSVNTSIGLSLMGPHSSEFMASGVPGTIVLAPYEAHTINVSGAPSSLGYKMATLGAEYNDGTNRVIDVALSMFAIGPDADGDGISDDDETRDLDLNTPGTQNPFDSQVADSTGEDGSESPDGVEDGDNDFDGDGMSNAEEFVFGYNPIDPHSVGHRSQFDTDGDGITDTDERRVFPGFENPFNPYIGDSTGDNGSNVPDGIPDGQNDYDGDGLSNSLELSLGLNPLDPDSWAEIPVSSGTTICITMLIMLWFGRSRLCRATRHRV